MSKYTVLYKKFDVSYSKFVNEIKFWIRNIKIFVEEDNTYFTIFSDSLSFLQSPHSMNIDHPYILNILFNYHYVSNQGIIYSICWIPSHIGTRKQWADKTAKPGLEFEIVKFKFPSTNLKHFNKLFINSLWRIFWNFCDTSKQYSIQIKSTYHIILIINYYPASDRNLEIWLAETNTTCSNFMLLY